MCQAQHYTLTATHELVLPPFCRWSIREVGTSAHSHTTQPDRNRVWILTRVPGTPTHVILFLASSSLLGGFVELLIC